MAWEGRGGLGSCRKTDGSVGSKGATMGVLAVSAVAVDELVEALARGQAQARRFGRPVLVSAVFPWSGPAPVSAWMAAAARRQQPKSGTGRCASKRSRVPGAGSAEAEDGCTLLVNAGEGLAIFAWGTAATLCASGPGRFSSIREQWEALVRDAVVWGEVDAPAAGLLAVGGFAFDIRPQRAWGWEGFGEALFRVPRVALTEDARGRRVTVNLAITAEDTPQTLVQLLLAELDRLAFAAVPFPEGSGGPEEPGGQADPQLRRVPHGGHGFALSPNGLPVQGFQRQELQRQRLPRPGLELDESGTRRWLELVQAAASAVRAGQLRKVVLARGVTVRAPGRFDVVRAVGTLLEQQRDGCVFAFQEADCWFVGATPERLARVRGGELQTAALAGTAPRGETPEEDRQLAASLTRSPKERLEHRLVVQAITEALAPLCTALAAPTEPQVVKLATVQHLYTPISGRLRPGVSLLEAVERLHPTPAVGGLPQQAALQWLRAHEGLDRGWYAAPVGWLDRRGGGEFWVAIRSGLLWDAQALLFAGCGILADSDPQAEDRELRLKLRPLLEALQRSVRAEREG